jgi:pentatricopeptide repeat protein
VSVTPTRITYAAAITACGLNGAADMSVELLDEMDEKGVTPDTIAYRYVRLS